MSQANDVETAAGFAVCAARACDTYGSFGVGESDEAFALWWDTVRKAWVASGNDGVALGICHKLARAAWDYCAAAKIQVGYCTAAKRRERESADPQMTRREKERARRAAKRLEEQRQQDEIVASIKADVQRARLARVGGGAS